MQQAFRVALAALIACGLTRGQDDGSPIKKVLNLLEEMRAQVSKEAEADEDAYNKYQCWCTTNEKGKTEAVDAAVKRIEQLEATIEASAGLQGQLKTQIDALETSIAEDQDSLAKATGIREKESAEFEASAKDMRDTIETMGKALDVLAKVQLVQKDKKAPITATAASTEALMQLKNIVPGAKKRLGEFTNVMQRDLWDVMSSIDDSTGGKNGAFLAQPTGNAAGAKSYNSRSGGIVGVIGQLKDDFESKLAATEKEEAASMAAFQKLRTAKMAEIAAGQKQLRSKEHLLADTLSKAAQAKDDLEATNEALSADQAFLVQVTQDCKVSVEEYDERAKVRNEEIQAIGEAIKILTSDESRDLFSKTVSFLQTGSVGQATTDAARNKLQEKAMKHLIRVARKHKNWVLATLAVHARLDGFEKVHKAMDKMMAELKEQQKAEVEKKDFCNKEIDETEDNIKVKSNDKEDLQGKQLGLGNAIETLAADLETLTAEIEAGKVSLKQAGEDRKTENVVFQSAVQDQRATVQILNKALARLKAFYAKKGFLQVPGQGIGEKPAEAKDYSKSGGSGGVIQLISMVISDAERDEAVLLKDEQSAQRSYEALVRDLNDSIQADEAAVLEKTKLREQANADKSQAQGALLVNEQELNNLGGILKAVHLDCDFVAKYFDIRQKARSEEMGAIAEAKAILSGADFGKAAEDGDDAEA